MQAPQIHLSLSPSNFEGDANQAAAAANNLKINLLPSDDPNVINLNICAANPPKQEAILVKQAATEPTPVTEPSPLSVKSH